MAQAVAEPILWSFGFGHPIGLMPLFRGSFPLSALLRSGEFGEDLRLAKSNRTNRTGSRGAGGSGREQMISSDICINYRN